MDLSFSRFSLEVGVRHRVPSIAGELRAFSFLYSSAKNCPRRIFVHLSFSLHFWFTFGCVLFLVACFIYCFFLCKQILHSKKERQGANENSRTPSPADQLWNRVIFFSVWPHRRRDRRSILSSMEASTSRNSEFCLRSSWDIFGKVGHLHVHWRPFGVTCLLLPI